MKTNIETLKLNNGTVVYGKFIGQIETEYYNGTDVLPNFVDYYFTIDSKYVVHDHKGKYVVTPSENRITDLQLDYFYRTKYPKKRGYHSRIKNNKRCQREMEESDQLPHECNEDWDAYFVKHEFDLPF